MIKELSLQKRQLGISLLEVLLSLSIIAIILIMATRYFFVASNNDKINTTVSQVGGLVAAAHSFKGADANYGDVNIAKLAGAGQLANFPGFNNDTNKPVLSTMWGSEFSIEPINNAGLAKISVDLPTAAICHAIKHAYPTDKTGNITATCTNNNFTYEFP